MFTTAEKLAFKSQIKSLKEIVANLESLLNEDSVNSSKVEKKKEKVVITSMTDGEKATLVQNILEKTKLVVPEGATKMSISYVLQKNEGHEIPFLNRNKLCVSLLSADDTVLTTGVYNKNTLSSMFAQLAFLGVFTYHQDHSATVVTLNL